MKLTWLFSFLLLTSSTLLSQCEYDIGGNGLVNIDDDLLPHLAVYGVYGLDPNSTDHNANGVTDILDLMGLVRHMGLFCPLPELEQSSGHVLGLAVEEYFVHEEALIDAFDTIPAGSVTYRLYVEVLEPQDKFVGAYGYEGAPMEITSSGDFYYSFFGNVSAENISPPFLSVSPTLAYSSWVSCDFDPMAGAFGQNSSAISDAPVQDWISALQNGESLEASTLTGGGWFYFDYFIPETLFPNHRLIGQFTVMDGESFSGMLNVEIRVPVADELDHHEIAEGLTFSSESLVIFGCTDPIALNFDPTATADNGTCTYLGDVDGDGEISVSDLLEIIADFGCTTCTDSDLNGDGVVGVGDLLMLLGLI